MKPRPDRPVSLTCSSEEIEQLKKLARSTTAGIWRIKRAKALLGALEGIAPERLMYQVRVPVLSIIKCIHAFSNLGMAYFDRPDRAPTPREAAVERMLAFLDNPPPLASEAWDNLSLRYIGTSFTARQIRMIREMIGGDPAPTRAAIARQVCSAFGLYGVNGKPRTPVAADILKRMAMDNLVCIPVKARTARSRSKSPPKVIPPPQQMQKIERINSRSLVFILVQKPHQSVLWDSMIHHYHYIPEHRLFGPRLRYLVYSGNAESTGGRSWSGNPLAALSFSPSAWRVSCRDDYIGWNDEQRVANLPLVINNSRFLILPWIQAPNLASCILGVIARRVPQDWEARYGCKPVLLESFVERERFRGTCYKAANWIEAGNTVGYSLHGLAKRRRQPTRAVFLLPLRKDFRRILCKAQPSAR